MPFPVLGSNSAVAGYEIDNSLRFNDDDSPKLQQTFSSAGNQKTNTFSCWFKLANLGSLRYIFANNENDSISFDTNDNLLIELGGAANGYLFFTNQKWRDVSAWYHLVFVLDTTNATAGNRMKVYLNGEDITSTAAASSNPSLNLDTGLAKNIKHGIGYRSANDDRYFDGYISEVYFIDGSAKAPTDFGETNDNGVWIPKTYSGSYGTNGFKLEFKNSGALGTDTSGNGNNFTATNLTANDVCTDSPTNNFCTMNPIAADPNTTLAEGNLKWTSGGDGGVVGTMAVSNGKWYWECKGVDVGADSQLGIWQTSKDTGYPLNQYVGTGESWGYVTFSGKNIHSDSQSGAITAVSDNDIMMFALDMDNYKLWFGINGTWTQSGNPATGANANHTGITDEFMTPAIASFSGSSGYDWRFNFGNPIVSISSGNSDGAGFGNFEYAPPSGFYSLCTKNLAEFG